MILRAFIISIAFVMYSINIAAQVKQAVKEPSQSATVNVVMTNAAKVPQKGEQVIFIAASTGKNYTAATDAGGKLSLQLPAGDEYTLKLKSLNDTTRYSTMKIPALQQGQYYSKPFTVTIQYDPPVTYTLNNVEFDVNRATLRTASYKELDEVVAYMRLKESQAIEIGGHTDNIGTPEANSKLSQQRAETVKAYLIKKGIAEARVAAKGYGDTQPVADNSTAAGRQKNRRTEVRLMDGE